jgi:hypothetical protein
MFFRILVWVGHLYESLFFYIYMFMYLYIAVLRKFLRKCVMLWVTLVLVCYVFMFLLWYFILLVFTLSLTMLYVFPLDLSMFFCIIDCMILSFMVPLCLVSSLLSYLYVDSDFCQDSYYVVRTVLGQKSTNSHSQHTNRRVKTKLNKGGP